MAADVNDLRHDFVFVILTLSPQLKQNDVKGNVMWEKTLLGAGVAMVFSSALMSTQALAFEAGDTVIKAGIVGVMPDASSSAILGTTLDVKEGTSLGISYTYMFSKNMAMEVLGALPFTHDIEIKDGDTIGETKHLPPTISLQYHAPVSEDFSVYCGIGLNYTVFFEEEANDTLKGILGSNDVDLKLDDSVGMAFQVGADWSINDQWGANLGIYVINIETNADVLVDGATAATVDVTIDPVVVMVGASMKF